MRSSLRRAAYVAAGRAVKKEIWVRSGYVLKVQQKRGSW
jgi:hypothetical protein